MIETITQKIKCPVHFPQKRTWFVGERVTQTSFHHVAHISRGSTNKSTSQQAPERWSPIPPSSLVSCVIPSFEGGPSSHFYPTKIYSLKAPLVLVRLLDLWVWQTPIQGGCVSKSTHFIGGEENLIPHQEKKIRKLTSTNHKNNLHWCIGFLQFLSCSDLSPTT